MFNYFIKQKKLNWPGRQKKQNNKIMAKIKINPSSKLTFECLFVLSPDLKKTAVFEVEG